MIITLAGTNRFLLQQRLSSLVNDFIATHGQLAVERIDASETELQAILEATQSLPFLATKKLVLIRDLSQNKLAAEQVEQIISSASPDTELIIYEPSTDKRTSFYKSLKSKTQLEEFNELDSRELPKWLVSEAQKIGSKLTIGDAHYLVDRVGPNQAILFSELQKLALHTGEITRESIDYLTEKTPQSKIFDLLDATFAGNKQKALELYEEQRSQKVEPQAIMALLAWQLQLIALAKTAGNKPMDQVAQEAKLNPYPLSKAKSLAAKITDKQLNTMISDALEIDHKSKTVNLDIDEALKTYIVTL